MGSARARSAQRRSPEGVAHGFHVSVNAVEPCPARSSGNLLPKHDARRSLADEVGEDGPEVASVIDSGALAGDAERLTRTRSGPDGPIVGPAGEPKRVGPSADSGEEVALIVPNKVICSNIGDAPFVDVARRDEPAHDQATKPSRGERVELVVVDGHATPHASYIIPPRRYINRRRYNGDRICDTARKPTAKPALWACRCWRGARRRGRWGSG
jgi:hypothetical protein